jgi:hypothetical protein
VSREVFGDAPGWQLAERARYAITPKSSYLVPGLRIAARADPTTDETPEPATEPTTEPTTEPATGATPGTPRGLAEDETASSSADLPGARGRRRRRRVRVTAVAATVTAIVSASAWGGYAISKPAPDPDVSVVVAGAIERDRWSGRAVLTIMVVNAGPGAVDVIGYAGPGAPDPGLTMRPLNPTVDAGSSVDLTVDLGLRCDQVRPFVVPDLLVETEGGVQRRLTPASSVATMTDFCATAARAVRPLRVASSSPAGNQLLLTISSPSGRPAMIHDVSALGVPLVTGSLPVQVGRAEGADGPGMARLRLVPPPECPASWRETGIPARLLVKTWSGGPATVSLQVGQPLIRWALDHVCPVP